MSPQVFPQSQAMLLTLQILPSTTCRERPPRRESKARLAPKLTWKIEASTIPRASGGRGSSIYHIVCRATMYVLTQVLLYVVNCKRGLKNAP